MRKTEKLGEKERKALFPSEGKGQDDDDDGCYNMNGLYTLYNTKANSHGTGTLIGTLLKQYTLY